MLHTSQLIPADEVLFEMCEEPEGLSEWSVFHEIDSYVRKIRQERARWGRGRNISEEREISGFLNNMIAPFGYRVQRLPSWRDVR